jgi:hypothetical protein
MSDDDLGGRDLNEPVVRKGRRESKWIIGLRFQQGRAHLAASGDQNEVKDVVNCKTLLQGYVEECNGCTRCRVENMQAVHIMESMKIK